MLAANRVMRHWQHRQLGAAFDGWLLATDMVRTGAKRLAHVLSMALRRMQNVQMARGMGCWVAALLDARQRDAAKRHEMQRQQHLKEQKLALMLSIKRSLAHWQHRQTAAAFEGWAQAVHMQRTGAKRLAHTLSMALRRMQQVQLSRGMGRWVASYLEARRVAAIEQDEGEMRRERERHMLQRKQAKLMTASRVLAHWQRRMLAAGFDGWLAGAALKRTSARQIVRTLDNALRRMQHVQLSRGMGRWVAWFLEDRRQEEARQAREQRRQAQLLTANRVLGHWWQRQLAMAFEGWALAVDMHRTGAKRLVQILSMAVHRMQHVQMARGMGCWVAAFQDARRRDAAKLHEAERRALEAEMLRQKRQFAMLSMNRVLGHWRHRALARGGNLVVGGMVIACQAWPGERVASW